jgi:hypothetical protein
LRHGSSAVPRRTTVEIPDPHYSLIDTERDGNPAVVVLNDALERFKHRDIFPWHLTITIEATRLAKNGMPTKAEASILDDLGDKIDDALAACRTEHGSINALFLARITWNGQRELVYRVHDPKLVDAELKKRIALPTVRERNCEMHSDEEWVDAEFVSELLAAVRN